MSLGDSHKIRRRETVFQEPLLSLSQYGHDCHPTKFGRMSHVDHPYFGTQVQEDDKEYNRKSETRILRTRLTEATTAYCDPRTIHETLLVLQRNQVELSGAATGKAVWPKHLKPVAWHRDSEMVRMKIGLYHAKGKVRRTRATVSTTRKRVRCILP